MKEAVALAKEAAAKKDFSPTRSDKSIHRARNEPERQLGSLRRVIDNIKSDGGTPSVESIATELSSMYSAQRASVLLALQRTHGNRYVQRVVVGIQAKLKVGQPGDVYEQEADRVAEAVMRMPEHKVQRQTDEEKKEEELIQSKPLFEQIIPLVQRQVEEEEDEEILQPKEYSGKATEVTLDIEKNINALRGSGQPLPESVRAFFEPRFGYDFSQVRIHADTQASEFAQTANARAFTLGRDMVFGAGQYQPETSSGRYLLAHELVHVVQQSQNFAIFHRSTANDRVDDTPDSSKIAQITNLRIMGKDKLETDRTKKFSPIKSDKSISPGIQAKLKEERREERPPCPTSVRVGAVVQSPASQRGRYRTFLEAMSRMDVGPGPDHSGHCMKERLTTVSNDCPPAVHFRGGSQIAPCTGDRCLGINQYAPRGYRFQGLTDGPTSFIDMHRTRNETSLLEGTGVNSCTVVCRQTYTCDRTHPTTGIFRITRNYRASTDAGLHITTGTVTKIQE